MTPRSLRFLCIYLLCLQTAAIVSITSAQSLTPVPVKQVAAPPSDIISGRLTLPDPITLAVQSHSAMLPVTPQLIDGTWSWTLPLDVLQRGARIALLPAQPDAWNAQLIAPDHSRISPTTTQSDTRVRVGQDPLVWIAPDRDFSYMSIQPNNQGKWTLTINADHQAPGFVLIDAGPETTLSTYTTTLSTLQNQPITLESSLSDHAQITSLSAEVTSPSGMITTEAARPGTSTITIFPTEVGSHRVRVIAQGLDPQNNPILLTTQHLIDAAPIAPLLKSPTIHATNDAITFAFAPDQSNRRTILAAEVWGNHNGTMTPIAWISTITGADRSLTLDTRWIALADVDPTTLELRAVRLHDIDTLVPLEMIDRVPAPAMNITLPDTPTSITPDMLTGTSPKLIPSPITPQITQSAGPGHRLMLVHGYCTDAVPFTVSHFSGDLAIFEDFEQSRSHDAFALQLLSQSAPMKSFGVVAHSQGGMGALHLSTYYWSGLDWAKGNRLIQSVGAPYQGTALAGNAAVLGDIFGFGCGENPDMTYAGSATWLSLIPTANRQQVYYYTTSFEDGFGLDYCNFITDFLLSDPDDGVIERAAGQLPGAHNMGHLEGWCHTADMRDPGQCTDQSRNTIMNQEAKR